MNGIRLEALEASDFLDVVHYFFEEDASFSTPEEAVATTKMRKRFYQTFYESDYVYGISEEELKKYESTGVDEDGVKPYIPPTEFNPDAVSPFGATLDAPIN